MASGLINIQEMASSIYSTVLQLNQDALNLIGLDCIWCRLLPYANGEDVIVQEYTLHSYDCPQNIQVVSDKTDYNLGNYSVDMFGIHQEVPLEVSVDVTMWEKTFGTHTMPQKGDFVYIQMLHRPFEVITTTCVYTLTNYVTSYKCQLGEWKHQASRKESEDFTVSIDALTDSQDRLFGEAISTEVADAVVEKETSYKASTYADTDKTFDIDSIVTDDILGPYGNVISHAYYDFSVATSDITYNNGATYDPTDAQNHWYFSTWFCADSESVIDGKLTIKSLKLKEKDYWTFEIESEIGVGDGDNVTIYRGATLKLFGVIQDSCDGAEKLLKIPTKECLTANKKIPNWWLNTRTVWKISKSLTFNLLNGYNDNDMPLSINIYGNNVLLIVNGERHMLPIVSDIKLLDYSDWHYLGLELNADSVRLIVYKNIKNRTTLAYEEKKYVDSVTPINIKTFTCADFRVENSGEDVKMANIRLYQNEYEIEDTYKQDMYSKVSRDASKLIIVDGPKPANKTEFVSSLR